MMKINTEKTELEKKDELCIDTVLDTKEGRWLFMRLMEITGFYQPSFNAEPVKMAYQEGKRAIGQYLLYELTRTEDRISKKQLAENEYMAEKKILNKEV